MTPLARPVALFDFDGTLTRRDSLLPFLRHCVGTTTFAKIVLTQLPELVGLAAGALPNHEVKQRVLTACFKGWKLEDLQVLGETFARTILPGLISSKRETILRWHMMQGHRCFLVSASLDLYLNPWSQGFGFEGVLCSQLEVDPEGRMTGRLSGRNVYGPEKVARIKRALQVEELQVEYAYGDSIGDMEMLSVAKFAWYRGRFRGQNPPGWMT